jgi:hypothetical protein
MALVYIASNLQGFKNLEGLAKYGLARSVGLVLRGKKTSPDKGYFVW